MLFLITFLYILAHFIIYCIARRWNFAFLSSEKGVFLFHITSFVIAILFVFITGVLFYRHFCLEWVFFTCGVHGIYSLSFLELWSLTQGSYSLNLIIRINSLGSNATRLRLQDSAQIGHSKTSTRKNHLVSLGLLREATPSTYELTPIGWIVSQVFRFVLFLTNGKPLNQ